MAHSNMPSGRPMTLRQQLDPILKAVYGCGRNSKVKMSDPTELDVWMTVDQAKEAIEELCQEIAREAVRSELEWLKDNLSVLRPGRVQLPQDMVMEVKLKEAFQERIAELTQKPEGGKS